MPPAKTKKRLPGQLGEIQRRMKSGYRFERTGGGHYRVRSHAGVFVEYRGKNITVSSNPSPGVEQALLRQLEEAQVLKGTPAREPSPEAKQRREMANKRIAEERREKRQIEATFLRDRLHKVLDPIGGFDVPGIAHDLGRIGYPIAREQGKMEMTPDLLSQAARHLLAGGWTEPRHQEVWHALVDQIEAAPDPVGEWFNRVRDVRGLPSDTVELRTPKGAEWPFEVKLLPLEALLIDPTYQRPVSWGFVRREAARFDPALVGTIDVAQRSPSNFAVLDGQQRAEICRMVGKTGVYCSIYQGLDIHSEARFFLHKNRDRKTVHPFYTFRARVAANDAEAIRIDQLVKKYGYKISIGAPGHAVGSEANISAIAALEEVFRRTRPYGGDSLEPTLRMLKQSTFGRHNGQNNVLIRGLGRVVSRYGEEELQESEMVALIVEQGPDILLGRARDALSLVRGQGGAAEGLARVLIADYNRRVKRERRLKQAA